jgi:hypothetical protein
MLPCYDPKAKIGGSGNMFLRRWAPTRLTWCVSAAVAATALLAGCGGSQQSQMTAPGLPQANNAVHSAIAMDKESGCPPHKGAVRVTPCTVDLSPSNPGPVGLSLKTPHGSKGSVREHDVCGTKGIATITGSGDSWSVTAGSNPGVCLANFAYFNNGHKVQFGRSRITNTLPSPEP